MIDLTSQAEKDWYLKHNCQHAHCPLDCEHPQPIMLNDGRLVCGRCLIRNEVITECIPCGPEIC